MLVTQFPVIVMTHPSFHCPNITSSGHAHFDVNSRLIDIAQNLGVDFLYRVYRQAE